MEVIKHYEATYIMKPVEGKRCVRVRVGGRGGLAGRSGRARARSITDQIHALCARGVSWRIIHATACVVCARGVVTNSYTPPHALCARGCRDEFIH